MEGIEAAISVGFQSIKLNVVLMAGVNDDEILDFMHFVKDKPLNVRFIEFMPFKNNEWQEGRMISYAQMKDVIGKSFRLVPIFQEPTDVAKDFAIEGFQGTVSFITSMTENFCGTCNRLRLMADGSIKSCLFFPAEVNIREDLRSGVSDDMITQKIRQAVQLKPEGHAAMQELPKLENRSMIQIGG
jgi:cyclic pyranopterin phosphate synthase